MRRLIVALILVCFIISSLIPMPANAQEFALPVPGTMIHLSSQYTPAHLAGLVIHPEDPFKFDFLIHRGDQFVGDGLAPSQEGRMQDSPLQDKQVVYSKLIKYFLASLTVPDEDQWVNLSPYEKERIINENFGKTEMGRDLLAQDYLLKQITASMIYPQDKLGEKFWEKVYRQAWEKYKTTNIPVNTFNKVWIVPDEAAVYESGNTVYVLKNHLKVMLEEDYLAKKKVSDTFLDGAGVKKVSDTFLTSQVMRQIILPELEREVNEGKNFANLRQIYSGMILATWYKRSLKESILSKAYANKSKVKGVNQVDTKANEDIYQQYLKSFKKGVFNYIKEDVDKYSKQAIPRKYFSGGMTHGLEKVNVYSSDKAMPAEYRPDAATLSGLDIAQVLLRTDREITDIRNDASRRIDINLSEFIYKFLLTKSGIYRLFKGNPPIQMSRSWNIKREKKSEDQELPDRSYYEQLNDENDAKSFDELMAQLLPQVLNNKIPGILYKPNQAGNGRGIFFIERNSEGGLTVTMLSRPKRQGELSPEELTQILSPGIEVRTSLEEEIMQFDLPKTMGENRHREILKNLWSYLSTREGAYDSGIIQVMESFVKVSNPQEHKRRAFDTRFVFHGNLSSGRIKFISNESIGRVGSSSYFSNLGGSPNLSDHPYGFKGESRPYWYNSQDMFKPVFDAFPELFDSFKNAKASEEKRKFIADTYKRLEEQFRYLTERLKSTGANLDLMVDGQFDLMWKKPFKVGDFPEPILVESWINLLDPGKDLSGIKFQLEADKDHAMVIAVGQKEKFILPHGVSWIKIGEVPIEVTCRASEIYLNAYRIGWHGPILKDGSIDLNDLTNTQVPIVVNRLPGNTNILIIENKSYEPLGVIPNYSEESLGVKRHGLALFKDQSSILLFKKGREQDFIIMGDYFKVKFSQEGIYFSSMAFGIEDDFIKQGESKDYDLRNGTAFTLEVSSHDPRRIIIRNKRTIPLYISNIPGIEDMSHIKGKNIFTFQRTEQRKPIKINGVPFTIERTGDSFFVRSPFYEGFLSMRQQESLDVRIPDQPQINQKAFQIRFLIPSGGYDFVILNLTEESLIIEEDQTSAIWIGDRKPSPLWKDLEETLIEVEGQSKNEVNKAVRLLKEKPITVWKIGVYEGRWTQDIARRNENIGLIVTENFSAQTNSRPGDSLDDWRRGSLDVQIQQPDNLAVLNGSVRSILSNMPDNSLDTIIFENTEARSFSEGQEVVVLDGRDKQRTWTFLSRNISLVLRKLKPGGKLIIAPYHLSNTYQIANNEFYKTWQKSETPGIDFTTRKSYWAYSKDIAVLIKDSAMKADHKEDIISVEQFRKIMSRAILRADPNIFEFKDRTASFFNAFLNALLEHDIKKGRSASEVMMAISQIIDLLQPENFTKHTFTNPEAYVREWVEDYAPYFKEDKTFEKSAIVALKYLLKNPEHQSTEADDEGFEDTVDPDQNVSFNDQGAKLLKMAFNALQLYVKAKAKMKAILQRFPKIESMELYPNHTSTIFLDKKYPQAQIFYLNGMEASVQRDDQGDVFLSIPEIEIQSKEIEQGGFVSYDIRGVSVGIQLSDYTDRVVIKNLNPMVPMVLAIENLPAIVESSSIFNEEQNSLNDSFFLPWRERATLSFFGNENTEKEFQLNGRVFKVLFLSKGSILLQHGSSNEFIPSKSSKIISLPADEKSNNSLNVSISSPQGQLKLTIVNLSEQSLKIENKFNRLADVARDSEKIVISTIEQVEEIAKSYVQDTRLGEQMVKDTNLGEDDLIVVLTFILLDKYLNEKNIDLNIEDPQQLTREVKKRAKNIKWREYLVKKFNLKQRGQRNNRGSSRNEIINPSYETSDSLNTSGQITHGEFYARLQMLKEGLRALIDSWETRQEYSDTFREESTIKFLLTTENFLRVIQTLDNDRVNIENLSLEFGFESAGFINNLKKSIESNAIQSEVSYIINTIALILGMDKKNPNYFYTMTGDEDDKSLKELTIYKHAKQISRINGSGSHDAAMVALNKGGIDFNSSNLNLQIKRDGKGVPLPFAQQDMAQINNIEGFVPVILEIKPAGNLPFFSELQAQNKFATR